MRELIRAERTGLASTLAYVVMPDHLHWLMQLFHGDACGHGPICEGPKFEINKPNALSNGFGVADDIS